VAAADPPAFATNSSKAEGISAKFGSASEVGVAIAADDQDRTPGNLLNRIVPVQLAWRGLTAAKMRCASGVETAGSSSAPLF
jgi:hypothetical protein